MGRTPACVAHRLSSEEQRVLTSFLAGRLPAGQVHAQLARARGEQSAPRPDEKPAERLDLVASAA